MKINKQTKVLILGVIMQITGFLGFVILYAGRNSKSYTLEFLTGNPAFDSDNIFNDAWKNFNTGNIAIFCLVIGIIGFLIALVTILTEFLEKQEV